MSRICEKSEKTRETNQGKKVAKSQTNEKKSQTSEKKSQTSVKKTQKCEFR